MTNPPSSQININRFVTKNLIYDFQRFHNELDYANAQLTDWYRFQQEVLLKKYQDKQSELKLLFRAMINGYAKQFDDELRTIDEQWKKEEKSESDMTRLSNLLEIGFSTFKSKIEATFIGIFRQSAMQIIRDETKSQPNQTKMTMVNRQMQMTPNVIPHFIVPIVPQPSPSHNLVRPVSNPHLPMYMLQKPVAAAGPAFASPPTVSGLPTTLNRFPTTTVVQQTSTSSSPLSDQSTTVVPLSVSSVVEPSSTPTLLPPSPSVANVEKKQKLTRRLEKRLAEHENRMKNQVESNVQNKEEKPAEPILPISETCSVDDQTDTSSEESKSESNRLDSPSSESHSLVSPSPTTSNEQLVGGRRMIKLSEQHQYISISTTSGSRNPFRILSRSKDDPSTTMIEVVPFRFIYTGENSEKKILPIKHVLDFSWVSSGGVFIVLTADSIYRYKVKGNKIEIQEKLEDPNGQSLTSNEQYVVCKTKSTLVFYSSNLKTHLNTWKQPSMELENFHSVDIQRTVLGLCGKERSRFYRILNGNRCEPVLMFDIPRGGSNLSIFLVTKNLLEVQFSIVDTKRNQIHFYRDRNLHRSVNVHQPIKCCSGKKCIKNNAQLFVLSNEPPRLEEVLISLKSK